MEFLYKIGFAICHQISERSFFVHDHQMPLCSRCTGIYAGIFITLTFYFFTKFIRHKKPSLPPVMSIAITSIIFILMMVFNAVSPMLHIPTNNLLRFITGILFGISLPLFIIPAINYSPKTNYDKERVISSREYISLIIVSIIAIFLVSQNIQIVNLVLSYISIVGLLMFVLLVNTAIIALLLENIKYFKITPYYYSFLIGSMFVGIELYFLSIFHQGILEILVK